MHFQFILKRLSILFISLVLSQSVFSKGYEISFHIHGISDTTVILANYLNKSIYPADTAFINQKGEAVFNGKKNLTQGMYICYLPTGKYFDFLIGEDQHFKIRTDTTNFIENAVVEGSLNNEIFFEFQKFMLSKGPEKKKYQRLINEGVNDEEKDVGREGIKKLMEEGDRKVKKIIKEYPNLFVSTFLKSTKEVEVPDPPVNADGSIDSTWRYKYFKAHYFDNFDPHDARLLHTPLYEDKIMQYLEKVILQMPDSIIKEVDYLIDGSRGDSVLFRYLLVTLFNHYGNSNIMGMDAVQVHLAEKYYLSETWWNDEKYLKEVEERVSVLKPLLLEKVAPNIELMFVPGDHFPAAKSDTALKKYPHIGKLGKIHDFSSDYTVLFFWGADCSHCKKAVPNLYELFKEKLEPEGIKVLAISTLFGEEGKEKWIDFVNKYETYDWIHAWNPYDYSYKVTYDIRTTPQIFILNKEKKIIGKRLGVDQVYDLIDTYRKHFAK